MSLPGRQAKTRAPRRPRRGNAHFRLAQAPRVGLHLLLPAADRVEAADVLAEALLIVHDLGHLDVQALDVPRRGRGLLLEGGDVLELPASGIRSVTV